ncbi:MAG: hypothetical protein HY774_19295 [Acidobacteria bacterium]|nr:hypothetical protein [Acidobacteriota bacterium]
MFRIVSDSLVQAARHWRLLLILMLATWCASTLVAFPIYWLLNRLNGHSEMADRLLQSDLDAAWLAEVAHFPELISQYGALFMGGLMVVGLLYWVCGIYLTGGLIGLFVDPEKQGSGFANQGSGFRVPGSGSDLGNSEQAMSPEPLISGEAVNSTNWETELGTQNPEPGTLGLEPGTRNPGFLTNCAASFGAFIRVALISVFFHSLLICLGFLGWRLISQYAETSANEPQVRFLRMMVYLLAVLSLVGIHLFLDYLRVRIVLTRQTWVTRQIIPTLVLIVRHWQKLIGVFGLMLVITLVGHFLLAQVSFSISPHNWFLVGLGIVTHQMVVMTRWWLKLGWYASEVKAVQSTSA